MEDPREIRSKHRGQIRQRTLAFSQWLIAKGNPSAGRFANAIQRCYRGARNLNSLDAVITNVRAMAVSDLDTYNAAVEAWPLWVEYLGTVWGGYIGMAAVLPGSRTAEAPPR